MSKIVNSDKKWPQNEKLGIFSNKHGLLLFFPTMWKFTIKKNIDFHTISIDSQYESMIFFWYFGWSIIGTFQPMFVEIGGNYDSQNV
jgi:hypothetical protein